MKFLIDMPLSITLARWLATRGHDAVHAVEVGLNRATDEEVIARAKRDGRTIVTADLDYPRLLAIAHATEPSLILFRGGNWSDIDVIARMQECSKFWTRPIFGTVFWSLTAIGCAGDVSRSANDSLDAHFR